MEVEECLGLWFGPGAILGRDGCTVAERPFSFLFRFPVKTQNERESAVYIRITRHPRNVTLEQAVQPNKEAAEKTRKYFINASTIAQAFTDTAFGSVRPLAHWPQYNAVVTEECPAQPLRQLFNWFGRGKNHHLLTSYLEQAGQWLNIFHQRVGQRVTRTAPQAEIWHYVAEELAKLEPYLSQKKALTRLTAQLESLSHTVSDKPLLWGRPHGDFHYGNVLVMGNDRIAVIDANASAKSRPVYTDLAKLIADPLTTPRQWLTFGLLLPQKQAIQLANAILRGYFGANQPPQEIIRFYVLLALIQKWAYLEKKSQILTTIPAPVKSLLSLERQYYFFRVCGKIASL